VQTGHLGYKEAPDVNGLLRESDEGSWDLWPAPMSMREVEAEILLQLDVGTTVLHGAREPLPEAPRTPPALAGWFAIARRRTAREEHRG
jgi:hypothetical protein